MNFLNKFFSGGNKNQKPSLLISDPKIKEDFESKSIEDIPSFDEEKMRNFNNIFSDDKGPYEVKGLYSKITNPVFNDI